MRRRPTGGKVLEGDDRTGAYSILPRRLPAASGVVQARMRPVLVGDRRRLGTYHNNVWLWKEGRARPNAEHMMALIDLAKDLGLDRLFKD